MQPVHVLLVEDDPTSAFIAKRSLSRSEQVVSITVACDGRDALDCLLSGALCRDRVVVVTDLAMPRMSGLQLVAAIRRESSLCELPVIVLTSSTEASDREAALAMDVAAYYQKASAGVHLEQTLGWLRAYCA